MGDQQSRCEENLITCVERAKSAATNSQQVPDDILRCIAEAPDSSLRELVCRLVRNESEKRPTAEQACHLVEKWFSRRSKKEHVTAEGIGVVKSSSRLAHFCKCLRPASPRRKATE